VLDGLGKRDSLLLAVVQKDDVFGELHANGPVSPCDKSPPAIEDEKRHCSAEPGSDCPAERSEGGQHRFSL
jgi:hypothetical protein